MDREIFSQGMKALKSNYANWHIDLNDHITLKMWFESLKDIENEKFLSGIKYLLATEEFYPNIAKIRKACASQASGNELSATEGWNVAKKAIASLGQYRDIEDVGNYIKNDKVLQIIKSCGWRTLCQSSQEDAEKRFKSEFKHLANIEEKAEIVPDFVRQIANMKMLEG